MMVMFTPALLVFAKPVVAVARLRSLSKRRDRYYLRHFDEARNFPR
jgi:hypothetical protein